MDVLKQAPCFSRLAEPRSPPGRMPYFSTDGYALGTRCNVVFSAATPAAADDFRSQIAAWIADFERDFSRFLPGSIVSRINADAGVAAVPAGEEAGSLLKLCDWFYWFTSGVFDPTTLPLAELWDYHNPAKAAPTEQQVRAALEKVGWSKVVRQNGSIFLPHKGMGLDLGGIGKEYAIDRVFGMAVERGFRDVMVDFGCDIRVAGSPPEGGPWRIGLRDAANPAACITGLALTGGAVATSAGYERGFEIGGRRYIHILDPRTGYPADTDCIGASAVATSCVEAGIIAKTCVILGLDAGLALLGKSVHVEALLRGRDRVLRTAGLVRYEMSAAIEAERRGA